MLSSEEIREIDEEVETLEDRRAASVEALKAVQRHRGWVSDEGVRDVADHLGLSRHEVDAVASFYHLVFRKPVGRHVILVCDSVSCWILGCERVQAAVRERLGIESGQTTEDGRFTLMSTPCLGACDHAPALMVDGDLHGDVRSGGVAELLEGYE